MAMRLLVLGGTAWVGGEVASAARDAGHDVVCAARGASGSVPEGVAFAVVDRDDPRGLDGLAGEQWDAVVDVTRRPDHARYSASALRAAVGHYVLVSTISVYASAGTDESAPVLDPLAATASLDEVAAHYGEAKVACELAVAASFGLGRCALVRPGLIAGPGDHTDRTGYWPWRFAHPASPDRSVLVPDAADDACQVVDVRDLATWLVQVASARVAGTFDAVGPPSTLGEHLAVARAVAGHDGSVVAASASWLTEQEVSPWSGPRSLPLWTGDHDESAGFLGRTGARAQAAGFVTRPIDVTYADTLAWQETRARQFTRRAGLTDHDEVALLHSQRALAVARSV